MTDTGMQFYRHTGDGTICWTHTSGPAQTTHWRAPRPHERPGITHCLYPHDHPNTLAPLSEADARHLLAPDNGRHALADRIFGTLGTYIHTVTPTVGGESSQPRTARSLAIEVADRLILDGYRPSRGVQTTHVA